MINSRRLNSIIAEALHRTLNEGQSDGNPIEKWNYWCANYTPNFIEEAWAEDPSLAHHLERKFSSYYDSEGSYGAMTKFYLNLSSDNRRILEDYIMNNY